MFEFDFELLPSNGGWNLVKFGDIKLGSIGGFKAVLFEPASVFVPNRVVDQDVFEPALVFVVNSGWKLGFNLLESASVFVPTRGVDPEVFEPANSCWGFGFSLLESASVLLASCGCGLLKLAVTASASFESVPAFVPARGFDIVMVAANFSCGMLKPAIITSGSRC